MNLISDDKIQAAGGDWAGLGEVTGETLLNLIREGKVSFCFAENYVLMGVENSQGQAGVYNIKHETFP